MDSRVVPVLLQYSQLHDGNVFVRSATIDLSSKYCIRRNWLHLNGSDSHKVIHFRTRDNGKLVLEESAWLDSHLQAHDVGG
mgnify:CR=1 FL=1